MSVRIIAQLNPFTTDVEEFQFSEGMSIKEILSILKVNTEEQRVFIGVNDELNIEEDYKIQKDDLILLKVLPAGEAGEIIASVGLIIIGAGLLFVPGAAVGGLIFMGAGASGIYDNMDAIVAMMTPVGDSYTSPKTTSPSYLRGGSNIIGKGQIVPLILGKHRYYPMQMASPEVKYLGDDKVTGDGGTMTWRILGQDTTFNVDNVSCDVYTQQLTQLYLLGHKEVLPIEGTYKRGDLLVEAIAGTVIEEQGYSLYGAKAKKYINVGKSLPGFTADGYTTIENVLQSKTVSVSYNLLLNASYNLLKRENDEPLRKEVQTIVLVQLIDKTLTDTENPTGTVVYEKVQHLFGGDGTISDPVMPVSFTGEVPYALNPEHVYSLAITRGDDRVNESDSPIYLGEDYQQSVNLLYNSVTCQTGDDVISANADSSYSYITMQVTDEQKDDDKSSKLTGEINDVSVVVQTHIPTYSGSGTGASAWNVTKASSNPAALFLYVLQGSPNARPVEDADIDWESLEAWYTFCENENLECNLVLEKPGSVLNVLKTISMCGRATFFLSEKYGVIIEQPRVAPMQLFTDKNTYNISMQRNISPSIHGYKLSLINEENNLYVPNELDAKIYRSGYNADGTDGKKEAKYMQKLEIPGVTNVTQMQALARFFLNATERRNQLLTISTDWEYLLAKTGDLVNVSYDELLLGIARGRLREVTKNGSNQVTNLKLDEEITMEAGKSYGVTIRYATGLQVTLPVNNTEETTQYLTLTTPTVVDLEVDDLYAFGIAGKETGQFIITNITPSTDLKASLTLVPYAPEIYTISDLPPYVSNLTIPSANRDIGLITEPFTPTDLAQQISSNISNVNSMLNATVKYAVKTNVPSATYLRDDVLEVKLSANTLYYISRDDLKLYKASTIIPEQTPTLIINKTLKMFDIDEDETTIVYSNGDDNNTIWKYDIATDTHTKLTTAIGTNPVLNNSDVLYINYSDNNKVYSTTLLDGGNGNLYLDYPTSNISMYNGSLLWVDSETGNLVIKNKTGAGATVKGQLFTTKSVNSVLATNPAIWYNTIDNVVPMYVETLNSIAYVNKEAFYGDVIKHDINSQGDYTFVDSMGRLYFVELFDERTQARLEAETTTDTDEFTGTLTEGDYRIKGISGADLAKIAVNDSISGTGIQGNSRVTYKGAGYITLNYPAGVTASSQTLTVFGTRLVLSANRVIVPGTITAGLIEANAMSSIAVVPDGKPNATKPLFSHNHLTGVEERYDNEGNLLFKFTPTDGLAIAGTLSAGTKTGDVTPGVPGFKVESDGSITANDGTFKGKLVAGTSSAKADGTPSTGFSIDADGNITANNGTFSGTVDGIAGSFTTLEATGFLGETTDFTKTLLNDQSLNFYYKNTTTPVASIKIAPKEVIPNATADALGITSDLFVGGELILYKDLWSNGRVKLDNGDARFNYGHRLKYHSFGNVSPAISGQAFLVLEKILTNNYTLSGIGVVKAVWMENSNGNIYTGCFRYYSLSTTTIRFYRGDENVIDFTKGSPTTTTWSGVYV